LLRRLARGERGEVAALAGLGIGLARIQAVFAGLELADHRASLLSIARQTRSASTVSRTSCPRTREAPRCTAASAAAMLPAILSSTSRPVRRPIVDLRDKPASTG